MTSRVTVCLAALACALLAFSAAAQATGSAPPVIKSVGPLHLKVGDKLTITGTNFRPGKRTMRVFFFKVGGGAAVWTRAENATATRLTVTIPVKLNTLIAPGQPARFHLRLLAHSFGRITASKLSPLISADPGS